MCVECGKHIYVNPRPTTSGILENERGEILLTVRGVDPGKGMLDFPGGFVDLGETVEEGFIREMREELGVEVQNPQILFSYLEDYAFDGEVLPIIAFAVRGTIAGGTLKAADDVADFIWVDPENLPTDNLSFPGMTGAMEIYVEKYRKIV